MTISITSPSTLATIRLSADKRDSSTSNLPANIEEDTQSVSSSDSGVSADSDHGAHGHGHAHDHGHGHSHSHGHDSGDDSDDSCSGAGHSHAHEKGDHTKGRRAEKVLWAVAALSAVFIAAEFVGGFWAESLAIMTDAGHMLSDLLSFIISIFAIRCARLPPSKRLSFGYERAEVLGALTSVIILWVLTTVLVVVAVQRIINNEHEVDANIMLITAGVGVMFNIIMGLVLHFGTGGHGHTHGGHHGHSHGDGKNVNVRAALIHVIGDLVQSIGVLIAAIIIKFTGWTLADPICTFLFSIIVLFTTITVMRDIFFVLMEATPTHFDLNDVKKVLGGLEGVRGVHDLHLWSIGMDKQAFSVHLALDSPHRAMETVVEARAVIRRQFGVRNVTIQVEKFDDKIESCDTCIQQETA